MPEPMAPAGIDDPIAGLIDIPLPAAISLWPETWVSRIVVAIAAAAIGAGVWALLARWFANRYRRAALAELDDIARRTGRAPFASVPALAVLVRRTALAAFPRSTISALDGDAWLATATQSWRPKIALFQWPLGAAFLLTMTLWLILTARGALRHWRSQRHA